MVERVKEINPSCKVEGFPIAVDATTVHQLLERLGSVDAVVDCADKIVDKVSRGNLLSSSLLLFDLIQRWTKS